MGVVAFLVLGACAPVEGQSLIKGLQPSQSVSLLPSDAAILDAREQRADLACELKPVAPELGYDFGFHTGYDVSVPLRSLTGTGNTITAIFRVAQDNPQGHATYFRQKWTVPALEDAKGTAVLRGAFVVGEGNYHVDWLLRDQTERFCSAFWDFSAARRGKDRPVTLWLGPGEVKPVNGLFAAEPPIQRERDHPRRLLVLFHVAPSSTGAAALESENTVALTSILRRIAREPHIDTYSITAFNLEQARVLYRERNAPIINFPALGRAIEELHLGTVSVQRLGEKDSATRFMADLLPEEMTASHPDAVIFVGSKGTVDDGAVRGPLKQVPGPRCPVFYLNYSTGTQPEFWRDAIGGLVKSWNGFEYTINKPRDISLVWHQVMAKLAVNDSTDGRGQTATVGIDPEKDGISRP